MPVSESFFPPAEPEPERPPLVLPEWISPPADEYPARVLIREFLARTPGTVLSLSHADVFSTGIRLKIEWQVRRRAETAAEWQLASNFHGLGLDPAVQLRYGLALADGSVVTTAGRFGRAWDERPEGWSLIDHTGGGGGDETRRTGGSGLWLWPLPPPGPLVLVAEWGARGVPESRLTIDGSALLAAVGGVRPLWP